MAGALNKGTQVDVILLDLAKAFDTVPHTRLVHKLSSYGIKAITAMDRVLPYEQISAGYSKWSAKQHSPGVPQNSVLGPLLFICYVNDMPDKIKSTLKLYADDALLYR